MIQDGRNGLLVDFFAPDQLAAQINTVLDHPDRMADIRVKARATMTNQYDLKKLLPQQIRRLQGAQTCPAVQTASRKFSFNFG